MIDWSAYSLDKAILQIEFIPYLIIFDQEMRQRGFLRSEVSPYWEFNSSMNPQCPSVGRFIRW